MSNKKEKLFVTQDNIFEDLGLENSEELLARSELLSEVSRLIKASNLSQKEIAKVLDISQPKVSMLVSEKLSAFSSDTLFHYLRLLGCNIEIRLKPRRKSRAMSRGRMIVHRKRPITKRKRRAQKFSFN